MAARVLHEPGTCLPVASSLLLSAGPDAWHHGRYGSEGQLCRDTEAALVADLCSGLCLAGFAGDGPMMGDTPSGVVARRMWPSRVGLLRES